MPKSIFIFLRYYVKSTGASFIYNKKIDLPRIDEQTLKNAGIDMVSIANNHVMDRGEDAVFYSNSYWKTKEVITAGSYLNHEEMNNVAINVYDWIKTEVGQKKLIMNGIIITIAISSATLAVVFIIILVFQITSFLA